MRTGQHHGIGLLVSLALAVTLSCTTFDQAKSAENQSLYILLEVELDQSLKDQAESTVGDIRRAFRKAQIGYTDLAGTATGVSVRVIDSSRIAQALEWIVVLNPELSNSVLPARLYNITQTSDGRIALVMTDAYKDGFKKDLVNRSIEVIRKRIDELSGKRISISQQGEDRIVVRVQDSQHSSDILKLFQSPPKLTFQLVDETGDVAAAQRGNVPPGDELLEQESDKGETKPQLLVKERVLVDGLRIKAAGWATNPQKDRVVVTFRFDEVGTAQLAEATKKNVLGRFAIVFDKKIVTAPRIVEPILGGSLEIEDGFTVQTASDLAALLRAGALPAPFRVLEARTTDDRSVK